MVLIVALGQEVFVDVKLTNSGNLAGTTYVRVTLIPQGQATGIDLTDTFNPGNKDAAITLNPGETATLTLT